jgi:hypothetical protein
VDRVCKQCAKKLTDEPAILVDGECFCFYHAKRAYPAALAERRREEQALNVGYKERVAEFERRKKEHEQSLRDRQDRRFRYSLDNGFSGTPKWLLYFFGVIFLWAAHPVAGFVSVIGMWFVVTIMEEQFQDKKYRQFDQQFPEPQFTEAPPQYRALPPVALQPHHTNNDAALRDAGYDRREILKRDGNRCQNCGKVFQDEMVEVHHVDPFAKGGTDSKRNLVTLCLKCHLEEDWFGHVHKKRQSFGLGKRRLRYRW